MCLNKRKKKVTVIGITAVGVRGGDRGRDTEDTTCLKMTLVKLVTPPFSSLYHQYATVLFPGLTEIGWPFDALFEKRGHPMKDMAGNSLKGVEFSSKPRC